MGYFGAEDAECEVVDAEANDDDDHNKSLADLLAWSREREITGL